MDPPTPGIMAKQRDEAAARAAHDRSAALELARQIADPWYATQAIAGVAQHEPDEAVIPRCLEAIDRAAQSPDPYVQFGAAAWALKTMRLRGREDAIEAHLPPLLELSRTIPHDGSRAHALDTYFGFLWSSDRGFWRPILDELLSFADRPTRHWRHDRALKDAIIRVASKDFDAAHGALERWPDCPKRRVAAAAIDPARRDFFPPPRP